MLLLCNMSGCHSKMSFGFNLYSLIWKYFEIKQAQAWTPSIIEPLHIVKD